MKRITILLIVLTNILASNTMYGQTNKAATNYLHVTGPLVFQGKSYQLSWSSHPAADYYKQEYLEKGENPDHFKTMILLEVTTANVSIKDIVAAKIDELKKMKLTNPMVNYESFDNPSTGEYMIDFLLSANGADGKTMEIVERNVYKYKTFTDKSGAKGVVLFGVSTRSYGNAIDSFLVSLKATKKDLVNAVAKFAIPAISLK